MKNNRSDKQLILIIGSLTILVPLLSLAAWFFIAPSAVFILLCAAASVIAGVFSLYVRIKLSEPLHQIAHIIQENDLSQKLPESVKNDAILAVSKSYNEFVAVIRGVLTN